LKIILSAQEPGLLEAWNKFCGDLRCVAVQAGSILDVHCDAVVSPANSYGFMDGGLDALYSEHFGWHVQDRLRKLILESHHGELLVGTAEVVTTDHAGKKVSEQIQTVAFPGLGTGVGRVSFAVCARQVRAALDEILLSERLALPRSWAEASERHQLLYTDRLRRLQY